MDLIRSTSNATVSSRRPTPTSVTRKKSCTSLTASSRPLGRRVDESSPMVDARLADGSRVNIIIPPLALDGPTISIRKFSKAVLTTEDLIANDTATPSMMTFLQACVKARLNIIVSGGTSTGKTTILNVLSSYLPLNGTHRHH